MAGPRLIHFKKPEHLSHHFKPNTMIYNGFNWKSQNDSLVLLPEGNSGTDIVFTLPESCHGAISGRFNSVRGFDGVDIRVITGIEIAFKMKPLLDIVG